MRRKRLGVAVSAVALAGVISATGAAAARADRTVLDGLAAYAPGEVLVRYEPGTTAAERRGIRGDLGAELEQRLPIPRLELLGLTGTSVRGAVAELKRLPEVRYAEPNFVYELSTVPDDPLFTAGELWGLNDLGQTVNGSAGLLDADIDAPEAWGTETGSSNPVLVAVVDTGVSLTHEDLDGNLWINPAEASGTGGWDDDVPPNGFIDDFNGANWVGTNSSDPTDDSGHGTHVAGTIAAEGNNATGSTGVTWDAELMALRVCSLTGCLASDIASAFTYAGAQGARVVNASISGGSFSTPISNAIAAAPGTLFVVSAGNDADDLEVSPTYPCSYAAANLICVAASNQQDGLASFSNYGKSSVDLAAPGVNTKSTYPLVDRASETFTSALGSQWTTDGTNNTWAQTTEFSTVGIGTLTDSPGDPYQPNTDSGARLGPIDLSADANCHLRYEIEGEIPDVADELKVQVSNDGVSFTTVRSITGTGTDTLKDDLTALNGDPDAYIRFNLVTNGSFNGDGVHLDDVKIRCLKDNLYAFLNGTSMASPHVAGAAALMLAKNPAATPADLRGWLLDGVDPKPSYDGLIASGGRLNLARSLAGAAGADIRLPDTKITAGPPPVVFKRSVSFYFSSTEPSSFRCRVDGGATTVCSNPRALSSLAYGPHSFSVYAVDAAGNADPTPAARSFTVVESEKCKRLKRKLRRAKAKRRKRVLRRRMRSANC